MPSAAGRPHVADRPPVDDGGAQAPGMVTDATLAAILRQAPAFMAVVRGPDHVFELVNDRYRDLIGGRDVVGLPVREALPEVAGQGYFELLDRVLATGEPYHGLNAAVRLADRTGRIEERRVDFVYQALTDADGRPTGVLAHGTDVTERVQAETALRESQQAYQALFDSIDQGFCVLELIRDESGRTIDFRYVEYNAMFRQQSGVADALGRTGREVVPDLEERWFELYDRVVRTGEPARFVEGSAGLGRWFDVYASRIGGPGSRRVSVLFRDITEARRQQALLTDHKRVLEGVAAGVPVRETLEDICDTIEARSPGRTIAGVMLVSADGKTLEFAAGDRYPPAVRSGCARLPVSPEGGACGIAALTHEMVVIEDVATDPRTAAFAPLLLGNGMRRVTSIPILSSASVSLGTVAVYHDTPGVTDPAELALAEVLARTAALSIVRHRADEALRRLADDLAESSAQKDDFIATMAHELRNPLAPIVSGVSILRSPVPTVERDRTLDRIERQLRHMVRLVDDLLDASRIRTGKLELRPVRLDLREAIQAALEASQPAMDRERHRLDVTLPDRPLPITGDTTRLSQILANVLHNAAKFTPAGGRVALDVVVDGQDAVLTVTDTGIGIPPEALGTVFDLFSQVAPDENRMRSGLGIGLTLARRLVEMHRGRMTLESAGVGRGTTVVIRLPLDARPLSLVPEGAPRRQVTRRRVLVVDDNVDGAESLALMLTLEGHEVRTAHDGPAGIALLREFRADVALLDLGLPGMDGCALARHLRADPATAGLKLVALTGWGSEADRERTREAGFDAHLIKPIDLDALDALLA